MIAFDTHNKIYQFTKGSVVYHFCSRFCLADFRNRAARRKEADDLKYGCWQCGQDLLQGLLLCK